LHAGQQALLLKHISTPVLVIAALVAASYSASGFVGKYHRMAAPTINPAARVLDSLTLSSDVSKKKPLNPGQYQAVPPQMASPIASGCFNIGSTIVCVRSLDGVGCADFQVRVANRLFELC